MTATPASVRPLAPFLISFALGMIFLSPRSLSAAAGQPLTEAEVVSDGEAKFAVPTPAGIARQQLLALLAQELTRHFALEGELEIDFLRPWTPPTLAQASDLQVEIIDYPQTLASSLLVRARVRVAAAEPREETFSLRARVWRQAWTPRLPLERGVAFDPAQCEERRVDVLRDRDALTAPASAAGEWMFVRAVPAGRLLTWRDVARRALVRKGDVIEVAAVDGPLQVTMKALAMQDGAQGETVRVRNLDTKREFAALVVAPNRAQVRF